MLIGFLMACQYRQTTSGRVECFQIATTTSCLFTLSSRTDPSRAVWAKLGPTGALHYIGAWGPALHAVEARYGLNRV